MKRILVVERNAILRQGLKLIIAAEFKHAIVSEVANIRSGMIQDEEWDVILLDINLPEGNGLDLIKEVREVRPDVTVLALGTVPEEQCTSRVIRAGAFGYLNKDAAAPEEVLAALKSMTRRQRYMSPAFAEKLTGGLDDGSPLHDNLSDREFEVLRLMAKGTTVKEMARTMAINSKTVSTYRARLLSKLKVPTTAALIRYALAHRLVD